MFILLFLFLFLFLAPQRIETHCADRVHDLTLEKFEPPHRAINVHASVPFSATVRRPIYYMQATIDFVWRIANRVPFHLSHQQEDCYREKSGRRLRTPPWHRVIAAGISARHPQNWPQKTPILLPPMF